MIEDAVARTAGIPAPILAIALNYGAQAEMVRAVRQIARDRPVTARSILPRSTPPSSRRGSRRTLCPRSIC
jgi:undecaprenyl diphosphate synthase